MNKYIVLLCFLFLLSCNKENRDDCITSTGKETIEFREFDYFDELEIYDHFKVIYYQASKFEVKISAGKNLLASINTRAENGKLIIKNNNKCNWVRKFNREINIEIYSPNLRSINYYGHNTITFADTLKTDTLFVNLWQCSGDLNLLVNTKYLELKSHTGTGTIICKGTSNQLVAYMGGNGFVNSFNCNSNYVLAVNENTGKLKVNAQKTLKADLRSTGNIEYVGSPIIERNIEGTGKLIDSN